MKKKGNFSVTGQTTAFALVFVIVVLATVVLQFHNMEEGVLDVCATQQDAYVQLVIDQVNLKENRTNQQIISEILGTLDASSNKYWTFSQDEAMLFVKDVLETNKYKGLTTDSYYNSQSAKEFIESLKLNSVTHSRIKVDDKEYLASGVMFEYSRKQFRLCLLSNESVYLDNNRFLEAKTELWLVVIVVLVILIVVSVGMASRINQLQLTSKQQAETIIEQNMGIAHLNDLLSDQNLYDAQNNMWHNKMLYTFLQKVCERGVDPVALITVCCENEKKRKRLLERTGYVYGKKVLRFSPERDRLLFIFVACDKESAKESLKRILPWNMGIEKCVVLHGDKEELEEAIIKLNLTEVCVNEQQEEREEENKEEVIHGN